MKKAMTAAAIMRNDGYLNTLKNADFEWSGQNRWKSILG
jgi:hypothetical protein